MNFLKPKKERTVIFLVLIVCVLVLAFFSSYGPTGYQKIVESLSAGNSNEEVPIPTGADVCGEVFKIRGIVVLSSSFSGVPDCEKINIILWFILFLKILVAIVLLWIISCIIVWLASKFKKNENY